MTAEAISADLHERATPGEEVLRIEQLRKHYVLTGGVFKRPIGTCRAVDGVSFTLRAGETLGLVGESGCGKSTLGRMITRLLEPTAGSIRFKGHDITNWKGARLRELRQEIQIVFQDPYASLNPRMTVTDLVAEPLRIHGRGKSTGNARVAELLRLVGLHPEQGNRFPHEFSGGQRQRIGIARALALNPQVLVLDEPVSALDVSIQAQIVNLLQELQSELGIAYLFIAHDLSVVRHIADRVAVMYLGHLMEVGERQQIYRTPTHPYTQALLSAVPIPDPALRGQRERIVLSGEVPSSTDPPSGCVFRTRCWKATDLCVQVVPPLTQVAPQGQLSACHYPEVRDVL